MRNESPRYAPPQQNTKNMRKNEERQEGSAELLESLIDREWGFADKDTARAVYAEIASQFRDLNASDLGSDQPPCPSDVDLAAGLEFKTGAFASLSQHVTACGGTCLVTMMSLTATILPIER